MKRINLYIFISVLLDVTATEIADKYNTPIPSTRSKDACNFNNLLKNGTFRCDGNDKGLTCTIHCNKGLVFEFNPEPEYTCSFADGEFVPKLIPQCIPPIKCDRGRIYQECGPSEGQALCGDKTEADNEDKKGCVKGCFCPEGEVWHENRCITRDRCPCKLHGKEFAPGSKVKEECNICTCINEKWNCTGKKCEATCRIYGDPHYKTFDGKKYDFMGRCSYYLVKTENISIEAENVACIGDMFQNLLLGVNSKLSFCTRTVTLKIERQLIKLKQLHNIVVNEEEIKIPYQMENVIITKVSSIFLKVDLPNGMQIWWDGRTRVYIDIPSDFEEETRGLCGTYNSNQKDDFLTPEDDIETSPVLFGNKWKISEKCSDLPNIPELHPCSSEVQNRKRAEQHCQIIKSNLFSKCHLIVDPEPYYEDCLYDTCSCGEKFSKCSCPIIATYADECSRRGVIIDWRQNYKKCGLNCPIGQKYQVCANSCTSTCFDISVKPVCKRQCVEGCNCPEGEALNEQGECVPIEKCKCYHDGLYFHPGYKEIRPGLKGKILCTCINASWKCHLANEEEIKQNPKMEDRKTLCNSSLNMEFTLCEPPEPITCKNMHNPNYFTPSLCHAGCKCKDNYVLDTTTKKCVKPSECPCHHSGKSYKENETVRNDCNTCRCQNGKWKCTDHVCAAECSTWGDSHFKTFDEKHYDFQGQCDYVLTKGTSGSDFLDVTIHKVSCGSLGTSCSKSITVRVGSGDGQDKITLIKDKPLPNFETKKHTVIKQKGLYVIVEAPDLGIVIRWDKDTRIYVKIDPRWKGKMKGLCGNYNDNEADDFQTPSGGITEVSAQIFGDSWKLHPYCPETVEIINTCEAKPERKTWASKKCDILKSSLFAPCHSEVPVNYYVEKCIFDSCACDDGDDCECFCTALATYAQECNNRGVPIKWRSQKLCPMQCDERSLNYYPCISSCLTETCDNLLVNNKLNEGCRRDSCIESCSPKPCPPDYVYLNSSFLECVPRDKCKLYCLEIEGVIYYEGDLIQTDECQSCYCSRHRIRCVGEPCTTPPKPITTTPATISMPLPIPTCPVGEKKETCAIHCDRLCLDYLVSLKERGLCNDNKHCEPGCVKIGKNSTCPKGKYLMTTDKCVDPRDCLCRSHNGKPVKPGTIYRESPYETCQCLNNEYICSIVTTTTSISTVPTTPTPNISTELPPTSTELPRTSTELPLTSTELPSTSTKLPPTSTKLPPTKTESPTSTKLSLTSTELPRTSTELPLTSTELPSTSTKLPQTSTKLPPTKTESPTSTELPLTSTELPRTSTKLLRTSTELPQTSTELPLTSTKLPRTSTELPRTSTELPVTSTELPSTSTKLPPTSTKLPPTKTELPASTELPLTSTELPRTSTELPRTSTELPSTSTKLPPTSTKLPPTKTELPASTELPLTSTELPPTKLTPTKTESPTSTELPLTSTELPRTSTKLPRTSTELPRTSTELPLRSTELPSTSTKLPPTSTKLPSTKTELPASTVLPLTSTELPRTSTELPRTSTELPSTSTKLPPTSTKLPPTKTELPASTELPQRSTELPPTKLPPTSTELPTTSPELPLISTELPPTPTKFLLKSTELPTTVTPPNQCDERHFKNLIQDEDQPLPDEAFSASSTLSPISEPKFARLSKENPRSWSPKYSRIDQYLDINLGRQEPVYGVIIGGSPIFDEYVTSYKVSYSSNGEDDFSYVLNKAKSPQIFRGPFDAKIPVRQMFNVPFEAQIVRISPHTWHNVIAIQVELIGCNKFVTTITPPINTTYSETTTISTTTPITTTTSVPTLTSTTTASPICEDSMGLDNGNMFDQQVLVSSSLDEQHNKEKLKLSSDNAWQPLLNSVSEFIEFDFWGSRIITGIQIKGGPNGWVTAFEIKYSHDNTNWNPIIEKETQNERIFMGNFDSNTNLIYHFNVPINATYVKIIPIKWHKNIQMRVEMLGCFQPYITPPPTPTPLPKCNNCPEIKIEPQHSCHCEKNKFWDGKSCVNRNECPCVVGNIIYPIGHHYAKEDCSECTCKLGGVPECSLKKCGRCEKGLRSVVTSTCECICQPCPDGTTLCPTSNICIDSTLWCNGVQDCADDEVNCPPVSTTPEPTPQITTPLPPKCPPGYSILEISHTNASTIMNVDGKCSKILDPEVGKQRPIIQSVPEIIINEGYICVSHEDKFPCPKMICSNDLIPVPQECHHYIKCQSYICKPPDAECLVTGRTFITFDKTEYKYDICDHILARDLVNGQWQIALRKNGIEPFSKNLRIYYDNNVLDLYPDLKVNYDGFQYTVEQTNRIGKGKFSISRIGDSILFNSNCFGFWIIWNKHSDVKLGVLQKLLGTVDGLCGYFNTKQNDDKRKPDGTPARTTVEFGDSWSQNNDSELCKVKSCPPHIRDEAWKICNKVENHVLKPCAGVLNTEAFISRCIETACECLQTSDDSRIAKEKCRCDTLQSFVVNCLTAEPTIDLSNWRTSLDCPVTCRAPLVHYDCYERRYEPSCKSPNCPNIPRVCFSGCYCPPGLVRNGDTCIEPPKCRDCKCEVFPYLEYVTYDGNNFTVNTNCVYVMSRDKILDGNNAHKFQVLITNVPCKKNTERACVGKVTILYHNINIHIANDFSNNKLKFIVNGKKINNFANLAEWIQVEETSQKHLKILLTAVEFEVFVHFPSLRVSLETSSHKYKGKLEGLCGNCNDHNFDDLTTPSGDIIKDVNKFISSWVYHKVPSGQSNEMCQNKPVPPCPSEYSHPCNQILDEETFGQCHPIVKPSRFFNWCREDTCGNPSDRACTAIEAYARECANAGFCIQWRTNTCPAKTCPKDQTYNPCGTECPETCESIKEKEKICSNIPVEGCFCPEGKVFLNNTCVTVRDCDVCDDEGHYAGEQWQKDKCTTCRCEGKTVKCETEHCPENDKICEEGFQVVTIPSKNDECCDKHACVPQPTAGPTCETPQPITCSSDQVTKLSTKSNGCQHFICECKPPEECEPIDKTSQDRVEAGYVINIDESGCCPQLKIECRPELCPDPKQCPQFHTLKNETGTGKCCPLYTCEPPKDKCIYENQYTSAEKGGERPRTEQENQKLLKNANETWKDGPCRNCKCSLTTIGNYQLTCGQTECSTLETMQDYLDFELEPEPVYDQCCPNIKRTACKKDGKIYHVGETWTKDGDYCTIYQCVNTTTGIQKETKVTNCVINCEIGSKYTQPEPKQCCGSCKPYACVIEGKVYEVGQQWQSPDHCTNYTCANINGSLQVESVVTTCPKNCPLGWEYREPNTGCCGVCIQVACVVDGKIRQVGESWTSPDNCTRYSCETPGNFNSYHITCPSVTKCRQPENIYFDGCCKQCNDTYNNIICGPEAMQLDKTIGIIEVYRGIHGACTNKKPISPLNKCIGACESPTFFDIKKGSYESQCSCCRPSKYQSIEVEVECEDSYTSKVKVDVPSECRCDGCVAP